LILEGLVVRTNAALVIIDPLVAYLQRGHNANNDQGIRQALASLKALGERTGVAIVVVRHLNKSLGANPLYRGGGSIGIIGAARCGVLLAQDPEHPPRRILAATKGNLGSPPASLAFHLETVPRLGVARVVWEGETPWTAEALLRATAEGEEKHSALGEARSWLRQVLADGPRPARELQTEARTMGISFGAYHSARKAEGVIARKEQPLNGGWIVMLPQSQGQDR
jgi:hypothetical protein